MNKKESYNQLIQEIKKDVAHINAYIVCLVFISIIIAIISYYLNNVGLTALSAAIALIITPAFSTVNKREELIYDIKLKIISENQND